MPTLVPLPPTQVMLSPRAMDAWYVSLSPEQRGVFKAHIEALITALPPKRGEVFDALIESQTGSAVTPSFLGADQPGKLVSPLTTKEEGGSLSTSIGSLTSSLVGIGVNIYMGQQQAALEKDLAKISAGTEQYVAQAQLNMNQNLQLAYMDVQKSAAQYAADAAVKIAQIAATTGVDPLTLLPIPPKSLSTTTKLLIGGGVVAAAATYYISQH